MPFVLKATKRVIEKGQEFKLTQRTKIPDKDLQTHSL